MSLDLNQKRRQRRLIGLACGIALAICAGTAVEEHGRARSAAKAASAQLAEARSMVKDIERLRNRPRIAALYEESPGEIAKRVSQAIRSAEIAPGDLLQVQPLAPIRVPRSQYVRRSTIIELGNVSLPQLTAFAHELENEQLGTVVDRLSLVEPQTPERSTSDRSRQTGKERWNGEVTLTQTIFSPTVQER